MSYLICDFMGDKHLCNVSENLVSKKPDKFKYLISHTLPKKYSSLNDLEHLDANLLYSISGLHSLNIDFSISIIDKSKNSQYLECLQTFLTCFDRIDPLGMPTNERIHYFWTLLGFYENYFNYRKGVSSIIFCNVPHMPWDILLFYFAKHNDIETTFLRKTGIGGYLYIDNDFRPSKTNIDYTYNKNILTLNDDDRIKKLSLANLRDMNFTKGQIGGAWNKKIPPIKKLIKDFAGLLGLSGLLTTLRIIKEGKPTIHKKATQDTSQKSTFAAYNYFSWFEFLLTHLKFQSKINSIKNFYNSIALKELPNKNFIYVSLHLQPERSTNPEGGYFDDQSLMIKIISESIPDDWCIIVKEHPKQFKYDLRTFHARSINFYKTINNLKNVFFIDSEFPQNELIVRSKITATVSGSVGWETLLNCKPSLIFSQNWHTDCNASQYVFDVDSTKNAIHQYMNMKPKEIEGHLFKFIENISTSLIYGALNNNHLEFFISSKNKDIAVNNIADAIIERVSN